jgi:hypothetical protein
MPVLLTKRVHVLDSGMLEVLPITELGIDTCEKLLVAETVSGDQNNELCRESGGF